MAFLKTVSTHILRRRRSFCPNCRKKKGLSEILDLPEEKRENLKVLLKRRAIGLVHVLRPIEEQRAGMRGLHSYYALSASQWSSYQRAEADCAAELQAIAQESQLFHPDSPPNALIKTVVPIYHSYGLNWPQTMEEKVHPDAKEFPNIKLQLLMEREVGELAGLNLQQEPPKDHCLPGQESRLLVKAILPFGFCHKFNESQSDPVQKLQVGDRIIAMIDGSVPPPERKPVSGNAEAMVELMTRECSSRTTLIFIVARILGPPLRFKSGQRVKARCGEGVWKSGTVVKLWETNAEGVRKPYVIRLDDDDQIVTAPRDSDDCVVKLDVEIASDDTKSANSKGGKRHKDGWARGMFKSKPSTTATKNDTLQHEAETGEVEKTAENSEPCIPPHPDARQLSVMRIPFLLKRAPGERLGISLNHHPPKECQQPGHESRLVVNEVIPGGFVEKFNASQKDKVQTLCPGDEIMAILNAGAPEAERKPISGNSSAMLDVITENDNGNTPLVFFVNRAQGPPLRFRLGERVKAYLRERGWLVGTVVKCWELGKPYVVKLETGEMVSAPSDTDDCITKADPRFKVGDRVMANYEGSYKQGEILDVSPTGSAYRIKLENGKELSPPLDANQCLRPMARFRKGDNVLARVACKFVPGTIEAVYHPMWIYSIRTEGGLVYAPEDIDTFVRGYE